MKMQPFNPLLIILASFMLLACNPDKNSQAKLFEEQRSALEKAKTVESTVKQQAQEVQQNLEKQTE